MEKHFIVKIWKNFYEIFAEGDFSKAIDTSNFSNWNGGHFLRDGCKPKVEVYITGKSLKDIVKMMESEGLMVKIMDRPDLAGKEVR